MLSICSWSCYPVAITQGSLDCIELTEGSIFDYVISRAWSEDNAPFWPRISTGVDPTFYLSSPGSGPMISVQSTETIKGRINIIIFCVSPREYFQVQLLSDQCLGRILMTSLLDVGLVHQILFCWKRFWLSSRYISFFMRVFLLRFRWLRKVCKF